MGSALSGLLGTQNQGANSVKNPVVSGYDPTALKASQDQLTKVNGGQDALAAALTAQMNGGGPNPALAQLNQTTAQNAEQAQAAITGQRGLNPALAAKMGADQLTSADNSAAANAATMRASQALGAQSQLAGVLGTQGQQALGEQGAINSANNNANLINSGVASQNANQASGALGAVTSGLESSAMMMADGGEIPPAAGGSLTNILQSFAPKQPAPGQQPSYNFGATGQGNLGYDPATGAPRVQVNTTAGSDALNHMGMFQRPTKPAPASVIPVNNLASGGFVASLKAMAAGGRVPGRATMNTGDRLRSGGAVPGKAAVKGAKDSYTNDTVAARLSPGEIVIPRHITQAPNAAAMAAKFVASVLARKGAKA